MDKSPLVSVMLCTYNRAHLIPRAIRSVLSQTYGNFELIIVDDGSTDSTGEIVRTFSDPRIVYGKHDTNRGVLAARNTCIETARGQLCCWLDDDDELLPDALQKAVNEFGGLSPEGIQVLWFDSMDAESGEPSGSGMSEPGLVPYGDLLCGKIRGDFWLVIEGDLLRRYRFDERLWGDEGQLWLRIHRETRAYYVPEVVQRKYREHGKRISDHRARLDHASTVALTEQGFIDQYGDETRRLCPMYYGKRLGSAGIWAILDGDKRRGRKALRDSLVYDFSLRRLLFYFLSLVLSKRQMVALYTVYVGLSDTRRKWRARLRGAGNRLLGRQSV